MERISFCVNIRNDMFDEAYLIKLANITPKVTNFKPTKKPVGKVVEKLQRGNNSTRRSAGP